MKKFLHKDKKDKEEKKKEKQEKKEKKEKEKKEKEKKKNKKDKHSASTSSLEVPDSPGPATSQSTTTVETRTTIPSDGATKTITVKETVKETSGQRVSETKTEENITGDTTGTNVIKQTTTTTITESKPDHDQPIETKTVVKETTSKTPQGEVVVSKTSSEVQSVPSASEQRVSERTVTKEVDDGGQTVKTITKVVSDEGGRRETTVTTSSNEGDNAKVDSSPKETKTVVKETTSKTPQREGKVVVTKTSLEVQSVPSTREFLTENFLKSADVETKGTVPPASQHVSERTVIKEVSDGGQTVKTVTKVVSDEEGRRETTVTTSSSEGDNAKVDSSPKEQHDEDEKAGRGITSENLERKADLPEWLNEIPSTSTPKSKAIIDDSIEIPSPPMQRKEAQDSKPRPAGPQVIEEILPISDSKENLMDIVADLEHSGEAKPKEEKPKPPEEIPFTYEPKKTEKKVYTGKQPVAEEVDTVKSANKAESAEIDFARLERREEPKPARIVQQTYTSKTISTNGDTTVTTTETVTDKDGKVQKTETKTISGPDQKPKQNRDINSNLIETKKAKESPKTSKRNFRDETAAKNAKNIIENEKDDDTDDDREVLEEIIVIEKKRKVRIPKSFVPYEKERPKAVLPIDLLIERQSRPRKLPPVGRRVNEKVEEKTQNRKSEIPDLDELDSLLSAMEVERSK